MIYSAFARTTSRQMILCHVAKSSFMRNLEPLSVSDGKEFSLAWSPRSFSSVPSATKRGMLSISLEELESQAWVTSRGIFTGKSTFFTILFQLWCCWSFFSPPKCSKFCFLGAAASSSSLGAQLVLPPLPHSLFETNWWRMSRIPQLSAIRGEREKTWW